MDDSSEFSSEISTSAELQKFSETSFSTKNTISESASTADRESASVIGDPRVASFGEVLREFADVHDDFEPHQVAFEPVIYTMAHAGFKYKKMCVRAHELELKRKIAERLGSGDGGSAAAPRIGKLARMMSYYPGVGGWNHRPFRPLLDQPSSYVDVPIEWPALDDGDGDTVTYFYKDPPAE